MLTVNMFTLYSDLSWSAAGFVLSFSQGAHCTYIIQLTSVQAYRYIIHYHYTYYTHNQVSNRVTYSYSNIPVNQATAMPSIPDHNMKNMMNSRFAEAEVYNFDSEKLYGRNF